ncbi:carbohydrate ABC transporter permease [Mahella australiensis]|uniref:Binding-protein-dependent transport systems inner membrane component n=1 Tax=Mahella australiensis (strain DSM 15567 / CIP 107919 / 50-1 BON) TaxID=697281 RepID=F3ZWG8_MAHA5|nr:carbohydrate ABC transporter permease [Mahella australiensis]AEE95403.1 binding-protein-dependent transport systems inner membrane component [Mahella australiensis 50-1 BON]
MNKKTFGDRIFDVLNYTLLILITIACLYPVLYVLFASVSDPIKLQSYRAPLYKPLGFTLEGYKIVLNNPDIIRGYANTIFYVVTGVAVNMIFTILGAYVISRKNLYWKKAIMLMITITMFFGGGLIPWFLTVKGLGMYDSWTALVFPFAINTWNMIIMRTGFEGVPGELEEAARIDGANDFYILTRVVVPLSKAVCAVILLYYVVGAWNSWFPAMIFLSDRSKYPLQLILREILITSDASQMQQGISLTTSGQFGETSAYKELVKYTTIVIATVPIMCFYPFIQKYFVKGVLIGSLKG